jgi:peptidoglycan/LPS O-acetylase OafA/YrhL
MKNMPNENAAPKPSIVRTCAIDYLRSLITVLVLVLHALLAYPTWGNFDPADYVDHSSAPIVDPAKWKGFDLAPMLLNLFFMALMFFISGLFVWKSLVKKGMRHFLKDRGLRLGIPFIISLTVIMPLAYYPSFLMTGATKNFFSYWMGWSWFSGPAWFISMLLVFNLLAVVCFWAFSKSTIELPGILFTKPLVFFLTLLALSFAGFIPLLYVFGPFHWIAFGPLLVGQGCRYILYLVYFFAGVAVGAYGLEKSVLRQEGPLSRQWFFWVIASFFSALFLLITFTSVHPEPPPKPWIPPAGLINLGFSMTLYCAVVSIAFLALFLRFANTRYSILDSLCDNAYGIYLVHYPFIIWSQYILLGISIHAAAKALIVFIITLVLSWGTSVLLRSIPGVCKIL